MRRLLTIAIVGGAVGACGTFLDTTPDPVPLDAGAPGDAASLLPDGASMTGETPDGAVPDGEAGPAEPSCRTPFVEDFGGTAWTPASREWTATGAAPAVTAQELAQFQTSSGNFTPSFLFRKLEGTCPLRVELQLQHAGVPESAEVLRVTRTGGYVVLAIENEQFYFSVNDVQASPSVPAPKGTWFAVTLEVSPNGAAEVTISQQESAAQKIARTDFASSDASTVERLDVGLIAGPPPTKDLAVRVSDIRIY